MPVSTNGAISSVEACVSDVIIESNVPARMRDGAVLRANVFRPGDATTHPTLLHRTPYGKEGGRSADIIDAVRAAQAGFAVVVQDVRGRWASDGGQFSPFESEFEDGVDTVAWCAEQPWSNGRVGCYGLSYGGFTSWASAVARAPEIGAIASAQSPYRYFGDLIYRGGALQLSLLVGWLLGAGPMMDAIQAAVRGQLAPDCAATVVRELAWAADHIEECLWQLPLEEIEVFRPNEPDFAPFFFDALRHDTADAYAQARSIEPRLDTTQVPAFIVAGWYDLYVGSDIEAFARLARHESSHVRDGTRLVVGPWSHANFGPTVGAVDFGLGSTAGFMDLQAELQGVLLRWFQEMLEGGNRAQSDPVQVFVQGTNRWRSAATWPPPEMRELPLYLHDDGRLRDQPPTQKNGWLEYVYDPDDPCPTTGGALLPHRLMAAGPVEQGRVLQRSDVLVFTTPVLEAPLELIGPMRAVLFASTDARDTDWLVRLCVVDDNDHTWPITDGVIRARFRDSVTAPQLLTPGEVVRYALPMLPTAYHVAAGQRLRVTVTSSDFPRYDRNLNTGVSGATSSARIAAHQTVYLDRNRPSHIVLPLMTESAP